MFDTKCAMMARCSGRHVWHCETWIWTVLAPLLQDLLP